MNICSVSCNTDETYTCSAKIYNNSGENITFRLIESGQSHSEDITVSSSDSFQTITISNFVIVGNLFKIQVTSSNKVDCYIDDIFISKS